MLNKKGFYLFGAPFDGTTSYRPGTRFAPARIRQEMYGIETYSPYQDKDMTDMDIVDKGDLDLPFGNPKRVIDMVKAETEKAINEGKIPVMTGGEHLVSLGAITAFNEKHKDLCVVHFDAHTDLREEYIGETLSHASVMKRAHDLLGDGRIFQFCIRSGEKYEFEFAARHTELTKHNFDNLDAALEKIGDRPVYFTIDLDCIDPSEFPGTGTPEAGGVTFLEMLGAIIKVGKKNIVGADLVELSPPYDPSGISCALACKTLRELILAIC